MTTTYILQKDLPDSKIGDKYIFLPLQGAYYKNGDLNSSYWDAPWVERNPEWFKPFTPFDNLMEFSKTLTEDQRQKFDKVLEDQKDYEFTVTDMFKCFQQSRLTNPMVGFKHDTFDDYLKTLK